VVIDGVILSKPKDRADASRMLHSLSGKWHRVITGVTVGSNGTFKTDSAETRVLLNSVTEEEIQSLLDRGEWHDKVGGYAIQGVGSLLVRRIDGDYYNVMGLPVGLLASMLNQFRINLWEFIS
jgi:septum formation protein